MTKGGLFPRLAWQNIGKNRRFFFPYILTGIAAVAMFYILCYLTTDEGVTQMPGTAEVRLIMNMGIIIIGLFSAVFLFYTNSFLIKRRRKELGLYSILGMEKRHICRVMAWENLFVALLSIGAGLAAGIVLSKLMLLVFMKLLRFPVPFGFSVSLGGLKLCAFVFAGIYLLTTLANIISVGRSSPMELLRGGSVGEKEPRTKMLLTIIGVLTLGAGYVIAIKTESPLEALTYFFVAVLLVIVGTYCLFAAGSIAVLKLLRANKSYYYKANHFAAVSGMLYRMKRNAVGLANICILSTMVLVTVSTTVCLYFGAEEAIDNQYPHDISIWLSTSENLEGNARHIQDVLDRDAADSGLDIARADGHFELSFSVVMDGHQLQPMEYNNEFADRAAYLTVYTARGYEAAYGQALELEKGQVYFGGDGVDGSWETVIVAGIGYSVKGQINDVSSAENMSSAYNYCVLVVPELDDMLELDAAQKAVYQDYASQLRWCYWLDLEGRSQDTSAMYETMLEDFRQVMDSISGEKSYSTISRQAATESLYAIYGGFLFLGIFLGTLFLMAAASIIYYKQISEGYDDRERYVIMQKVGMSQQEVKASISSQILTVFFLPLVMAMIHIAAAFKMITRLLEVFSLTNVSLFAMCCLGTALAFAVVYVVIYLLTARTYYQIVKA